MAKTWNEITVDQLDHVSKTLSDVQSNLAKIAVLMHDNKMGWAFGPWTPTHTKHLSAITTFAEDMLSDMGDQVTAKKFGHKCRVQVEKEKAVKTTTRRKRAEQTNSKTGARIKKGAS